MSDAYLNSELKQRLVGAGVLLILAGLLWPLLFDFDQREALEAPALVIPTMPVVKKVPVAKPKAVLPAAKPKVIPSSTKKQPLKALISDTAKPAPIAGKPTNKINDADRPRLDKQGVPVSFVVQVGRFKRWSNADALRNSLIKNKHKAYITPAISTSSGPYTVLIGPLLTFAKAEAVANKVKLQTPIKDPMIKRFGSVK
ncbi:SPOR domain-containing protein [Pseudomonadales bacterium]|nr:SPOR domain-containing protein [Pseudomonadales bacterium]